MKTIYKTILLLLPALVCIGCSVSEPDDPYAGIDGIRFSGSIAVTEEISTRANPTSYNVTNEFYDCNFYLRVEERDEDNDGSTENGAGTYVIPSGYEGALIPKTGDQELNWFSRDKDHDFWGWTFPQDQEFELSQATTNSSFVINFPGSDLNDTANEDADEWKNGTWGNGRFLEQFIGAWQGPYTYNTNGIYVPLQFRHLVSKIFLTSINVVDNVAGTSQSNLKGTITFFGMPSQAVFYPCPRDIETGEASYPYVEKPQDWSYPPTSQVTYALTNQPKNFLWEGHKWTSTSYYPRDCWYICPELDFSEMSFKIEIYEYNNDGEWTLSPFHGRQGAYYGDFKNVKFARKTPGEGYSDPEGGDETILHAGEYLSLTFNLYEKGNPTVQGIITDWNGNYSNKGQEHLYPGIYTVQQLNEMNSIMSNKDPDAMEEFYEINGSGKDTSQDPEGEYPDYEEIFGQELKIFYLYDDIAQDTAGIGDKVGSINVADGYILDGQGHTINTHSGSSVTLGRVRNVYIRYYYSTTERLIYIDNMGYVWLVDPVTLQETKTNYNINNPKKNPVSVNFSSGNVS